MQPFINLHTNHKAIRAKPRHLNKGIVMSRLSPVIQEANRIAFIRSAAKNLKKMQIRRWLKENPEIGTTTTGRFYKMVEVSNTSTYKMKYVYPPVNPIY